MTVISKDFPQKPHARKSDPIAHSGKQNVLVYHTQQNLLKLPQGVKCQINVQFQGSRKYESGRNVQPLQAMMAHSAVHSSTRTLFTRLFCIDTLTILDTTKLIV